MQSIHFVQAAASVIRNLEVVRYSGAAIALYMETSVVTVGLLGESVNGESTVTTIYSVRVPILVAKFKSRIKIVTISEIMHALSCLYIYVVEWCWPDSKCYYNKPLAVYD